MVWGSSSREEILYGVGWATDSMGVCQYPGRCYHSEACMTGVGSDVTHASGQPPNGNTTLLPFYSSQRARRESFFYADTSFSAQ